MTETHRSGDFFSSNLDISKNKKVTSARLGDEITFEASETVTFFDVWNQVLGQGLGLTFGAKI